MLAIVLEPLHTNVTPLALLAAVALLAAIPTVVVAALATVFGTTVDRRWPASELLSPSDLLWSKLSGVVGATFEGLDDDLYRDLTAQMREVAYPAGSTIVERDDAPSLFMVVKAGKAVEVTDPQSGTLGLELGPGQSFGEVDILRRRPYSTIIRALTDCVVLFLPAEDYLAGTALRADDDDRLAAILGGALSSPQIERDSLGQHFAREEHGVVARSTEAEFAVDEYLETPGERQQWRPTHVVPMDGVPAWAGPDATRDPETVLSGGVQVQLVERRGNWARVRLPDGYEGWVDGRRLATAAE